MDYTVHGILRARILEWVAFLYLLQGIFPTQGLNPGLPHCRRILYQLSYKGSPRTLEWVAYPFFSRSSWPRNWTGVFCIAGRFFTNWAINYTSIKKEQFFIENKHFLQGKKRKKNTIEWEKLSANHVSDKGLVFSIYIKKKNPYNKNINQTKNEQRIWTNIFQKKIDKWSISTWKDVQYH